jgi:biofilm PGA synthesis N-glycosyltransferase PgaC
MFMLEILFWASVVGLGYIYAGYPLGVWLWAHLWPRPVRKAPYSGSVSVVIAAYNEEAAVAEKIRSLLEASGSELISEILVASDGSTDGTVHAAKSISDSRIQVEAFPDRRGKASVLNDVVPRCQNDLVVLTDARQTLHPQALSALLSSFVDPHVGVVSGALVLREPNDSAAVATGVVRYWNYEKSIRRAESLVASVPGATGAFYAIRKNLFQSIPPDSLLDDVAIPMQAVMQGYRCIFEEEAEVYDWASKDVRAEAVRKRRTLAGNLQLVGHFPAWLLPWKNPIWLQFISHKLARLLTPFLLVLGFVSSLLLWCSPFYLGCLLAQLVFYAWVLGAWGAQQCGWKLPGMGLPLAFFLFNTAIIAAWADALHGQYDVRWKRSLSRS